MTTTPAPEELTALQTSLTKVKEAIERLVTDGAESASFEGNTVNRIQLERLEQERDLLNYRIGEKLGQLHGVDIRFGSVKVTRNPSDV